jgi:hypothetical protein
MENDDQLLRRPPRARRDFGAGKAHSSIPEFMPRAR